MSLYFIILFCISFFAYSLRNLLFSTAFLFFFAPKDFSLDPTPLDEEPLSYDHTLYDPTSLHPDSSSSPHHQESIPPVVDVDMDTSDSSSGEAFLQEVLSEPRPPTRNISLETSIRNRLRILQEKDSRFLLGMSAEEFWKREVKDALAQRKTLNEYNVELDLQSAYLQIKERGHDLSERVLHIVQGDPNLQANAPSDLRECIFHFCTDPEIFKNENEAHTGSSLAERNRMELSFLDKVVEDIKRHGPSSSYIRDILDHSH